MFLTGVEKPIQHASQASGRASVMHGRAENISVGALGLFEQLVDYIIVENTSSAAAFVAADTASNRFCSDMRDFRFDIHFEEFFFDFLESINRAGSGILKFSLRNPS